MVTTLQVLDTNRQQQIQLLRCKTDVLIGVHGAGLSNYVFTTPTTIILQVCPYEIYRPILCTLPIPQQVQYYKTIPLLFNEFI